MEQLFKKIKEIEQTQMAEREAARARGEHFNIFAVCGVNHYEVKHSFIIAELLNPQGSHGQGSLFLYAFLTSFYSDFNFRSEGVSVVTEYDIHDGRIDILIRNSIGQAIIIENKIYAQDQYEQLKRYNHYAHNHFGDGQYEILYLTLYGEEPSKANTGDKNIPYRTISYATTIVEWLEDCIKLTARLPIIRETLIQYQNHILKLTGKDMNAKDQEEIFKLMVAHPHETATIVNATKNGYLQYVYETFCREGLTEYAINNGFTFHEQENINDGFYFQRPEWKRTCIKICRSGDHHYIGISNSIDGSDEDLAALPQQKLECFDCSPDLWWPYGNAWLEKYDDWSAATDTIPVMIDGSFVNFIIDIVDAIMLELQNKKCKMI